MPRKPPTPRVAEPSTEELDRQYQQIRQAIQQRPEFVENLINQSFPSPKSYRFFSADFGLADSGETIDLVFVHSDPEDLRYVLIDMAIPYLNRGRKYTLEAKSKRFVQQQSITTSKVKKGILLVKRSSQAVTTFSSRIHVPIIEIAVEDLIPETKTTEPASAPPAPPIAPTPRVAQPVPAATADVPVAPVVAPHVPAPTHPRPAQVRAETPAPVSAGGPATLSPQILDDLKNTIVQECLTTLHKRRNKYIRKGLWKWIEREIVDPNTHFFLVILSCIYQGDVGEVLSRRFKSCDEYSKTPEVIADAIFSRDAGVAGEIVKNSDRHRRALKKFLECFSATPPFDYLRSLFLKEFRTNHDSIKARTAVFDTLKELMQRCGFEGEKEVQYPLEILDELGIFQGFIMGNFTELRVDNAGKKLRQLVPGMEWTPTEIYRLRDQLATRLDLPPSEFNLNAYLPQKFISSRKDVTSLLQPQPRPQRDRQPMPQGRHQHQPMPVAAPEAPPVDAPPTPARPRGPVQGLFAAAPERSVEDTPASADPIPQLPAEPVMAPPRPPRPPMPQGNQQPRPAAPAFVPTPPRPIVDPNALAIITGQPRRPTTPEDLEEARHRHFDLFGGHTQPDPEMTRFGIDYARAALRDQKAPDTNEREQVPQNNRAPSQQPFDGPEMEEEATPTRRTLEMRENRLDRPPRNQKRRRRSGGGNRPRPAGRGMPFDGNRR